MSSIGAPPLKGIKVVEFAGLAPGPFAGMQLADAGASVLRIDRAASGMAMPASDVLTRHKASVSVNLKSSAGVSFVRDVVARADVLIDPYRPGVLEKLGLGPDALLQLNPRLIYARITGYRRDGKYSAMAGHDINYLAVSGALSLLGRANDSPHPPTNLLADFAGGGANLVNGILLALLARGTSGKGQVVEANMVDGASYLATFPRLGIKRGMMDRGRGNNLLDGGCPFYETYATADGKYVSVGALEPQFFGVLVAKLGIDPEWEEKRMDADEWPALRAVLAGEFKKRTRSKWETVFDGTDACVAPVLEYPELETDAGREGDQRPSVTLRQTPCLAITRQQSDGSRDVATGQGRGVDGDGYEGHVLEPNQGAEDALNRWFGWTKGRDYHVTDDGGFVRSKAKL